MNIYKIDKELRKKQFQYECEIKEIKEAKKLLNSNNKYIKVEVDDSQLVELNRKIQKIKVAHKHIVKIERLEKLKNIDNDLLEFVCIDKIDGEIEKLKAKISKITKDI